MIHPARRIAAELGHALSAMGSLLTLDDAHGAPPRPRAATPPSPPEVRHLQRTLVRRSDQLTAAHDLRDAALAGHLQRRAPSSPELVDALADLIGRWVRSVDDVEHVFMPRRLHVALACVLAPAVAEWVDAAACRHEETRSA